VITPSEGRPAVPRFELRTLGTLRVAGVGDATVIGDHGHQRRRLAVLAVLAAAGDRGRSRDQLLGLFWPDVDQSRARHSLEQLLYAIRTSIGADVFIGVNPLRLNAAVIRSDIDEFHAALERGEVERAAGLYGGRFLDGFYLTDSSEFEQWMEAERGRIERKYIDALERLARDSDDRKDYARSVTWRRKLTEADPLSSKHAIGLIRALANAGDTSAALQFAEKYEADVARELGTGVGREVAEAVAQVRNSARTESVVVRGSPPPPKRAADSDAPPVVDAARVVGAPSPTPEPRRRTRFPLAAFAALALIGIVAVPGWLRYRDTSTPDVTAATPSIAVLPLENMSGDSRQAYLADGITEELIGVIGRIPRLRVTARTSAFVFKDSRLDVRQIAESLHVSHVLEGSVQSNDQKIRVQVRLVDARDGSTLWSQSYDRELREIFAVQSDIANAIAHELDLRIAPSIPVASRRPPTTNVAAHELYLRGSDPTVLRSDSGALAGLNYFRQAIALDSTYAAAWAGLARMYVRTSDRNANRDEKRRAMELARQAAEKAVSLDDSLAEAHASVGLVAMQLYDFATAERELTQAMMLEPQNSRINEWMGFVRLWQQQPALALAEAKRAVENDPLSPSAHAEVAHALCALGRYSEGLDKLKQLRSVEPPLLRVVGYTLNCHAMRGDWQAALDEAGDDPSPQSRMFKGYLLARAGKRDEALAIRAELMNRLSRTHRGAGSIAVIDAGLGNLDSAFMWLDRAIDDNSLSFYIMMPMFARLHADPRFALFRRRLSNQNR
jgi:TolB-like protein/DNA-binding SARP family transcriptional activator/tetratricopeptide (TPR) repeat protein